MTKALHLEDYNVTGIYLRGFLASLRKISGKNYSQLLEEAGLQEFQTKYPAADEQVVANGAQLTSLFRLVRHFLGADGYSLFMRNLGREFAHNAATFPVLKILSNNVNRNMTQAEFVQWVTRTVNIVNKTINHVVRIEPGANPNEIKIIYPYCIYCMGQTGFTKPGCPLISTFYRQVILELTGISCQMDEVRCGAMHDDDSCQYILRRL
jgi:predicted hydrocarbon binding protein